jgi:hypothetical protein
MTENRYLEQRSRRAALLGGILGMLVPGCYRSPPPEIPEFNPPPKPVEKEMAPPEVVEAAPQPVADEPPAEAEIESEPVEAAAAAPPPAEALPEPEPVMETAQGPTIIGTWRCVEMLHNGQSMPLPEGMEMTMTFTADGTVTISSSGGGMPEPYTSQGTYALDGDQITISAENDTQTGTCTFDGNDRMTIDIAGSQMVLMRA